MKRKIPFITILLILLNLAAFAYELNEGERVAAMQFAMFQGALEYGEYLRAVASSFIHFGVAHLVSNMICLAVYGFDLENRIGPVRFLLIYAAGIIGSALLVNYAGGTGLHAGASGAVWALMTATVIYNLRHDRNPAYALRGIVLNLVYSFSANVSWQGHIGGGIAGLLAALVLCRAEPVNYYENT